MLRLHFCLFVLSAYLAGASAADYRDAEVIVSIAPGHTAEEVAVRRGFAIIDSIPASSLYLFQDDRGYDPEQIALLLPNDPGVDFAEANYFIQTMEAVRHMVVAVVGGTWGDVEDQGLTERIGLTEAHESSRGQGIVVAVLDTGVDSSHPALACKIAPGGWDFVDGDPHPMEEIDGLDNDGDGLTDGGYGHGTMVAGIVSLIAPAARILPVRVLDDEGRGDAFTIDKGVAWALDQGADVLNMSFGGEQGITSLHYQIQDAWAAGVTTIAGSGNEGRSSPKYFPASDTRAFMVTAVDSSDVKADFANYNSKVLVSAPGTGVLSTYPGGEFAIGSGCSFAAPMVTGETALMLALDTGLDPEQIEGRIEYGTQPIDHLPGNEPFEGKLGAGRIHLPTALIGLPPLPGSGPPIVHDPCEVRLSGGREYLAHRSPGTWRGVADGPVTWRVEWQAPPTGTGPISFYAFGNAANNDGDTDGDYFYTSNRAARESTSELDLSLQSVPAEVARGGSVQFTARIDNAGQAVERFDAANLEARGPLPPVNIPLYGGSQVPVQPGAFVSAPVSVAVPGIAPLGTYGVAVSIFHNGEMLDAESFLIEVVPQ